LNYIKGNQNSFAEVDFCPEVKMEIFMPWATRRNLSDQNDRSVAVRLDFGSNSFLFVGDIEGKAEEVMLNEFTEAERKRLDVDVLKVGHHGSDTSSRVEFINEVSPKIAVVSVGKRDTGTNERYKHPRLSTMRNFLTWFRNHPPTVTNSAVKIPAYDADTSAWKQQTRPAGVWLTVKDGSVTVTSDGRSLQVSTTPTPH
jgi:beta-lactamase superfamily II metal-dependent hydrolase